MRLRTHLCVLVVAVASSAANSQLIWLDPINPNQPVIAKAYGQAPNSGYVVGQGWPGGLPLDWGYGTTPTPITNAQGQARDASYITGNNPFYICGAVQGQPGYWTAPGYSWTPLPHLNAQYPIGIALATSYDGRVMVGQSRIGPNNAHRRAARWVGDPMTGNYTVQNLGSFGGDSIAHDCSEAGDAVAGTARYASGLERAFYWHNSMANPMIDLGHPFDPGLNLESFATGISPVPGLGGYVVVGGYWNPAVAGWMPGWWEESMLTTLTPYMKPLPLPGGFKGGIATKASGFLYGGPTWKKHRIVGWGVTTGNVLRALVWDRTPMNGYVAIDLSSAVGVNPNTERLHRAVSVSHDGRIIVGEGARKVGNQWVGWAFKVILPL